MSLIYYWRPDNYRRDRSFGFGYHLNQNSPAMESAAPGESLWAFTRRQSDGVYVLAAELVIRALTRNPDNYRYGRWRIWGDIGSSRYFDIDVCPRVDPLVRELGIPARGERLGQSFQGHAAVRYIPQVAHQLLSGFSRNLPVSPDISFYREDEFEAGLVHDQPIRRMIRPETRPEQDRRMRYLFETVDVRRARKNVLSLQELYDGRCQICLYHPRERYGHPLCHGHHIEWLSRGGEDELDNMVLICPNHHSAVHRDDSPFDFADFSFTFKNGLRECLVINTHLPAATAPV